MIRCAGASVLGLVTPYTKTVANGIVLSPDAGKSRSKKKKIKSKAQIRKIQLVGDKLEAGQLKVYNLPIRAHYIATRAICLNLH